MHSKLSEHLLVTLLRQVYSKPRCYRQSNVRALRSTGQKRSLHTSNEQFNRSSVYQKTSGNSLTCHERAYSTSAKESHPDDEIAVLGGGITGLASAFYLTKELPNAKITLYEASDRLGGWLQTKYVDVGDGTILFEQGPRTLRPKGVAGHLTLDLVLELGIEDQIIATSKDSVAATNRFVYYPDRLVAMPSPKAEFYENLWSLLTQPVFGGGFSLLTALGGEFQRPDRPEEIVDESVGSFLRRRLGTSVIGDNVVSAVLHGIYAGDIEKLSIQSLMPTLWSWEQEYGSISNAYLSTYNITNGGEMIEERDVALNKMLSQKELARWKEWAMSPDGVNPHEKLRTAETSSVYSFQRGIVCLSEAFESYLRTSPGVEIRTGHKIDTMLYQQSNNSITIKDKDESKAFSRVISTISGNKLSSIARVHKNGSSCSALPTLAMTPSVTVMVVNLFFRNPDILPEHGFGYLIPRSIPYEQNPECALGVVFDSDATFGQDSVSGTKITVMIGGHWWDGLDKYPDEEEGASMAKAVVKRHLKIEEEPEKVLVSLQRDCIPQYTVGHHERMIKANSELTTAFNGRMAVAGSSYTGVGVNDCIKSAWDVVDKLKYGGFANVTGLEHFLVPRKYVPAVQSLYD